MGNQIKTVYIKDSTQKYIKITIYTKSAFKVAITEIMAQLYNEKLVMLLSSNTPSLRKYLPTSAKQHSVYGLSKYTIAIPICIDIANIVDNTNGRLLALISPLQNKIPLLMNQPISRNPKTSVPLAPKSYGVAYRAQVSQKSQIATKYEMEAGSLRPNEQNLLMVREQHADLSRQYKVLLDKKNLMDMDFRNRHDSALRYIGQLKNQTDVLGGELKEKLMQAEDLRGDEDALKHLLQQKNSEIEKYRKQVNVLLCDADQLQNERISLLSQIDTLTKSNLMMSSQALQLQASLTLHSEKQVELENYMGQLGKEETMLKTKIKDYETTNNELDNKIQEIAFDISEMSAIIKQSHETAAELQNMNAKSRATTEQLKMEVAHSQKSVQNESARNSETGKKIKQIEHTLRVRESQVTDGYAFIQSMRSENEHLHKINSELPDDLEACIKHLELLGMLNRQLVECFEGFSEEDRKAAEVIVRNAKLQKMRKIVEETHAYQYCGQDKQTARTDTSFTASHRRYLR